MASAFPVLSVLSVLSVLPDIPRPQANCGMETS